MRVAPGYTAANLSLVVSLSFAVSRSLTPYNTRNDGLSNISAR